MAGYNIQGQFLEESSKGNDIRQSNLSSICPPSGHKEMVLTSNHIQLATGCAKAWDKFLAWMKGYEIHIIIDKRIPRMDKRV